jgi:hypothetical protein
MKNDHDGITNREAAAAYVAELAGNLATIARQHGLDALGFILEMARLEAENAMRNITAGAEPICA